MKKSEANVDCALYSDGTFCLFYKY